MIPQEKDLIQSVFDRLARAGVGQKDKEADALIRENVQRLPDAPYGLVQAVISQEMSLNQAAARLNELQRQLDEARNQTAPAQGGFMNGGSPWGNGSVPRAGGVPATAPQPAAYAAPPAYAPQQQQPQQPQTAGSPWGGGGFLRNAATMAAGVAGGTLLAQGIGSLFGGHQFGGGYGGGFGGAGGSPWGGRPGEVVENVTVNNNYYGDQQQDGQDPVQDASYDDATYDTGLDGGFDDSSDI